MTRFGVPRDVLLLAVCQGLFMTATSAIVTSIALAGFVLADDKSLSTIPVAFQFAATMATALPASMYMKRVGRRVGFMTGAALGAVGGVVATYAIFAGDFWLFCIGNFLIGSFNSFAQFFRFAAADASDAAYRSRAISLVLAGGVVAAVTGPNLARLTRDLFEPVVYAGTFAGVVALYIAVVLVVMWIRIPPPSETERSGPSRPLAEIIRQPECIVAILGAVIGYLVMSFLMTITPLAMADCGFSFGDSAFVIQLHIVGMFLPSFVTGHLIARYGVTNVMLWGAGLLFVCVVVNVAGVGFLNFVSALTLLGVGWNFLFTGGTTLLTQCYRPAEKAKVQGLNDMFVWGAVMLGAVLSGAANHSIGWINVNMAVAPLVLVTLLATLWLKVARPRPSG